MLACACAGLRGHAWAQTPPPTPAPITAALVAPQLEQTTPEVQLNGVSLGRWKILEKNGVLYAPASVFEQWQLPLRREALTLAWEGQTWYPLLAVRGIEMRLDAARTQLSLRLPGIDPPHLNAVQAQPKTRITTTTGAAPRVVPVEVTLNSAALGPWNLLELNQQWYATADTLQQWRVASYGDAKQQQHAGETWYALASLPDFSWRFDAANQALELTLAARAFTATRLTQATEKPATLAPAVPMLFLNYDLSYTASANSSTSTSARTHSHDLGLLTELGLTGNWGVLTSSAIGRNTSSASNSWYRLETTYTLDFPEPKLTLRLGDTVTRSNLFSGSGAYFGGLQIGRNFSFTPGYVTQPVPVLSGASSAPSTVELYINDALRQTAQIPSGPFVIDNLPVLTGSGQARMVVRDLLGRETVTELPFFTHGALLAAGLSDWSFELGSLRRNLGSANADYGYAFASGLWRIGLSNYATLETQAQLSKRQNAAGLGLSLALPWQVLAQVAWGLSRSSNGLQAQTWQLGFEHSGPRHSLSANVEAFEPGFSWIGGLTSTPRKQQWSAGYSYSHPQLGVLGLSAAKVQIDGLPNISTLGLNYALRLGQRSSLNFNATRVIGAQSAHSVGVSLTTPLDNQVTVASSATRRNNSTDGYVSASRNLTEQTGFGWRVLGASQANQANAEGGLYYQGNRGVYSLDLSARKTTQTVRLGTQGSLALIDGSVFATRTLQDSVALVEVPGQAGIGLGLQGSKSARTDERGRALLPRLQAFSSNAVQLDPNELPISAEIDSIEQTVVPGYRRAVRVHFPVRSGRAALVRVVFDDGEPAPAGAQVSATGDTQVFYVARRGEVFLTGLAASNQLRLLWNGVACVMPLELPPQTDDDIARLGPINCAGVQR